VTNDLAVETRSLVVRRGKNEVLHGLDVHIPQGQLIGLLGPSGSGKTTLLRAILGSQQIASGSISVLGHPAGSRVLRKQVGYMAQTASIYDDLTVQQNLDYFAAVLKAPRDDVARVLEAVDLTSTAKQLAANLSGGQRTRVSLAIALLGTPQLLILDEPTVGSSRMSNRGVPSSAMASETRVRCPPLRFAASCFAVEVRSTASSTRVTKAGSLRFPRLGAGAR